jgi:hypothetical protein
MENAADDFIKSLRETISIAVEAHELMVIDVVKASKKVERLKKENEKLKKKLVALRKEMQEGEK